MKRSRIHGSRRNSRTALLVTLVLCLAVLLPASVATGTEAEKPTGAEAIRCTRRATADQMQVPAQPIGLGKPEIKAGEVVIEFGRGRNVARDSFTIPVLGEERPSPGAWVTTHPVGFAGAAPDRSFVLEAQVSDSGRNIFVTLCWDPSRPVRTPPGEYRGQIWIEDRAFSPRAIPMVVRLQEEPIYKPTMAVTAGALIGTLWQSAVISISGGSNRTRTWRRQLFGRFNIGPRTLEVLVAVLVGLVVAFFAVLFVTYGDNPSWTGSFESYAKLAAAAFAASSGAYGTGTITARVITNSSSSSAEPLKPPESPTENPAGGA